MIHQHPLAYLLGLEGLALLRCFAGEDGEATTRARLADVRRLLDLAEELGPGAHVAPITTEEGYRGWAPSYDGARNQLIGIEQPLVRRVLAGLPVGDALDAACGTGRHTAFLADLGHQVTGVDSSPDMLAVARDKVPGARFARGELDRLPVPGASTDLVVCALALTHVPDLVPVMTEFARVLRPGGHLVVSGARNLVEGIARPLPGRDADGEPVHMPGTSTAPVTTSPPSCPWASRSAAARSRVGPARWSAVTAARSPTRPGLLHRTVRGSRRTSGRCTPTPPRPPTRPTAARPRPSSGTSSSHSSTRPRQRPAVPPVGGEVLPGVEVTGTRSRGDTPGVVLVTGAMASGKSTVAQLLAQRFPRAAHVRGDVFRRFVVSGRAEPTPPVSPQARQQLELRHQLAAAAADAYAAAGFVAVVQDVIIGPVLAEVVAMITTRPVHLVVLDPDPHAIEAREQQRCKSGYGTGWTPGDLVHALRTTTPRIGLWLDTTDQTPQQTADTILDRLTEARVDPRTTPP